MRALIIVFGRGYYLIAAWLVVFVIQHLVEVYVHPWIPDASAIGAHPWLVLWHVPLDLVYELLSLLAFLVVAIAARDIDKGRPVDFAAVLTLIKTRWLSLVAVLLAWLVVKDVVGSLTFSLFADAARFGWAEWINEFDFAAAVGALVVLCSRWSILDLSFANSRALGAFIAGFSGPWKRGIDSVILAVAYAVLPFLSLWSYRVLKYGLGHPGPNRLAWLAHNFVDAVFATLVTVLLVVVFAGSKALTPAKQTG